MARSFLLASVLASALAAASASAQAVDSMPTARFPNACSTGLLGGGPTCPFEQRLVVELQTNGPGAPPELRAVVGMGAVAAGVFALSLDRATANDSLFYAVVHVERDAAGSYSLRTGLAGARAPGAACGGAATGGSRDLAFGAFLATQVTQLVRCAQTQRQAR